MLQDGRLSSGDRLLQVNEESVIHMRSEEVAERLHSLDEARETIRLVVAHSEREGEGQTTQEVVPEVMDVSNQLGNLTPCELNFFLAVVRGRDGGI